MISSPCLKVKVVPPDILSTEQNEKMKKIVVLFGTESGNAEMAADDIAAILMEGGLHAEVTPMEDYSPTELAAQTPVVLVTSTYAEGELPETTAPFYGALEEEAPDLTKLSFAAFGLGDSTYKQFNNAILTMKDKLVELGATAIGDVGMHDAASGKPITDVAKEWARKTFSI